MRRSCARPSASLGARALERARERQASLVFEIAALALLVTSVALHIQRLRERNARRLRLWSFAVGGGGQLAAIGADRRF